MKVLSGLSKKLISLIVAVSMVFIMLSGTVLAETLAQGDGNAWFYFDTSGLDVGSNKNGFSVNGNEPNYITSDIKARTEWIDKSQLKAGEINTITIYTGNANDVVDETLSRNEAGRGCDEFGVTTRTLTLILPNGCIVYPSKIVVYTPKDADTPLKDAHNATVYTGTGQVALGDSNITEYAYKLEIQFDLTDVDWNPDNDMEQKLPAIKNVSLEIGAEPSRRNIVWYSTSENDGEVQLAPKSAMTGDEFPADSAAKFSASASVTGLTGYTSYKATMTGLAENTEYVYRVGNADAWSDVYSFKTQSFDGSFSFVALSDPQLGQGNRFDNIQDEIAGWTDTLEKAQEKFTQAAFLACLGDQIAKPFIDGQFDAFFSPEELKTFALAAVPGNHDSGANYTPHYNMPNVSTLGAVKSMGAGSGDYWFTYGDALFMTLNVLDIDAFAEHVEFLENTIAANPNAKWKIVMMHYGMFGGTKQGDDTPEIVTLRNVLAPELSRLGIDVVLNGHEHSYTRSYLMNAFTPNTQSGGSSITDPNPSEVLYVTLNSASGTDYVTTSTDNKSHIAAIVQEEIPHVSNVEITDSSFAITTYRTSDMSTVDAFTINRSSAPVVKSVFVSPKDAVVKAGATQTFVATASGYNEPSQEVIWSVSGNESDATTISQNGVLSVGGGETAESLVVTATSKENDSKYAQVTVTVESNIIPINVGQGVTYLLPDGETYADTSKVGYRIVNGTDGVAYRVNVGEYKVLMSDNFESYAQTEYTTAVSKNITGGTFTKGAYLDAKDSAQKLAKDGDNTVASFGPNTSALKSFMWKPKDKSIGEAFKVSYKLRVDSFDLDSATVGSNYFFVNNFSSTGVVQLFANVVENEGVRSIKDTRLHCVGTTSKKAVINDIKWTNSDTNNVISMEKYITVEIEGNNTQYSASVNGNEVANSIPFDGDIGTAGVDIRWAKRSSLDTVASVTYADELVYSKAVYVTDTLTNQSVEATITQGAASAQTATVTLNMSDGTTKDFTVNYTADTSATGTSVVKGTIDGFDDTIPVTVTVKNIITEITATGTVIEKATIQQVGNITSGVAVFAYYGSDHKFAAVKSVPFAESDFANGMAELSVGLVFPEDVQGGYVKGFVFENLTSPAPLDVVFHALTGN